MSSHPLFRRSQDVQGDMYARLHAGGIDSALIPWVGSSDPPVVQDWQAPVLYVDAGNLSDTLFLYLLLLKGTDGYVVHSSFLDRSEFHPRDLRFAPGNDQGVEGWTQRWVVIDPTAMSFDVDALLAPTRQPGFEMLACVLQHPDWVSELAQQGRDGGAIWMPGVRWADPTSGYMTVSLSFGVSTSPEGDMVSVRSEAVPEPPEVGREKCLTLSLSYSLRRKGETSIFIGDEVRSYLESREGYSYDRAKNTSIPRFVL